MKPDYTVRELIISEVDSLRDEILACISVGDYVTAERLSKEIESLISKINS